MSKLKLKPQNLLTFYREVEKLKTTLRHSWLNNGIRQESVAEHTWMMLLLSTVLLPYIQQDLDQLKVMKMIVVHDLAEAVTKDMPVWEGVQQKEAKHLLEKEAITKILNTLETSISDELLDIWHEYEQRKSTEAVFVKALDTLDVISQHNVAPLSTWDKNDYLWQLSPYQDAFFNIDPLLRKIKDEIDAWSIKKVRQNGELEKLDQSELQKRQK